ncbi:MAG: PQQ-like beta-propeller repeat protein, partial [Candidatus Krumholzibacteria bacterium]|nr:PQQ-like beta-propeller repeat protein [Candidatus Krumholzibacteria bacterium]
VDTETGRWIWDFDRMGVMYSHPSIAGGVVYWGCGDKHLYALAYKTGELLWRFEAEGGVKTPTPTDGMVLFCSGSSLYALH